MKLVAPGVPAGAEDEVREYVETMKKAKKLGTRPRARIEQVMRDTFAVIDPLLEKVVVDMGTTCRKGCSHCCYLLNTAHPVEGYYIAQYILRNKPAAEIVETVETLRSHVSAHLYDGINQRNFFRQQIPCPFLDTDAGTCRVYEYRPSSCRYHYVTSPPEACSPAGHGGTTVLDTVEARREVTRVNQEIQAQGFGADEAVIAPLSLIVLWAMKFIIETGRGNEKTEVGKTVLAAYQGLPTPIEYITRHVATIVEEAPRRRVLPVVP